MAPSANGKSSSSGSRTCRTGTRDRRSAAARRRAARPRSAPGGPRPTPPGCGGGTAGWPGRERTAGRRLRRARNPRCVRGGARTGPGSSKGAGSAATSRRAPGRADGVVLVEEQRAQGPAQHPRRLHLGPGGTAAAVGHGRAGVTDEVAAGVGLLLEALHAQAVGAREEAPVDAPRVVAGLVVPVLAELHAQAVEGAAVDAAQETLHHVAGLELQARQRREQPRIEALGGRACGDRGSGMWPGRLMGHSPPPGHPDRGLAPFATTGSAIRIPCPHPSPRRGRGMLGSVNSSPTYALTSWSKRKMT